jgi:hypothetical protein
MFRMRRAGGVEIEFPELQERYGGRYVALDDEKNVICDADSFVRLMIKVRKLEFNRQLTIHKIQKRRN